MLLNRKILYVGIFYEEEKPYSLKFREAENYPDTVSLFRGAKFVHPVRDGTWVDIDGFFGSVFH